MKTAHNLPRKAVAAIAVGTMALAGTLALGAPAQAAERIENFNGCTVARGLKPVFSHLDNRGDKVFNYRVRITCEAGRKVRFQQEAYERDGGTNADDLLGSQSSGWHKFNKLETKKFNYELPLKSTEKGEEEIYHRIRIKVRSDNGVTSGWSSWVKSATLTGIDV